MIRIIPLSILVFVSFASVCLARSESQEPQKNWKTYQSQWNTFEGMEVEKLELKFEVKYPQNWFVILDRPDGIVLANFSDGNRVSNPKPGDMWMWIGGHSDTATHGQWVEIKWENSKAPVLWLTFCWNPLSIDLFVLKNDPDLEKNQKLLFDISDTFKLERR